MGGSPLIRATDGLQMCKVLAEQNEQKWRNLCNDLIKNFEKTWHRAPFNKRQQGTMGSVGRERGNDNKPKFCLFADKNCPNKTSSQSQQADGFPLDGKQSEHIFHVAAASCFAGSGNKFFE